MRLKMRGRSFRVGDWLSEREILGEGLDAAPRLAAVMQRRNDLLRRLGVRHEAKFERGDLLIAGRGFGLGTRRDHAALLLKAFGVGAVLAQTVDPRFRASAIRLGLPVLTLAGLEGGVQDGDELIVDCENGTIENLRTRRVLIANPPSPRELRLISEAPGMEQLGIAESMEPDPDVMEVPAKPTTGDSS